MAQAAKIVDVNFVAAKGLPVEALVGWSGRGEGHGNRPGGSCSARLEGGGRSYERLGQGRGSARLLGRSSARLDRRRCVGEGIKPVLRGRSMPADSIIG